MAIQLLSKVSIPLNADVPRLHNGCSQPFPRLQGKCFRRTIKSICGLAGNNMWQSLQSLIFNYVLFLTLVICDNKCYSCVIFPLCVWERIQQAVYPPAGMKQGQRGHQQRTEMSLRQRRHLPRNTPLSKSGSQGLALSIFVLSGFWQLRWEAWGLSYPAWDINKLLMTGNSPRYTMRHRPLPNQFKSANCATHNTHTDRETTTVLYCRNVSLY